MARNGGNKMKRFLAIILATLMLAAMVAVPAMAEQTKESPDLGGNVTPEVKPDEKPGDVTSPDTSDALAALIGTLTVADGALVCYYLKKRKVK